MAIINMNSWGENLGRIGYIFQSFNFKRINKHVEEKLKKELYDF